MLCLLTKPAISDYLVKGLRTPTSIPRDVLFECLFVKYSYNRFSNRKSALCKESIVLINIFKHDQILFTCLVESEENVAAEVSVSAVVRDRGVRRICVARSQVSWCWCTEICQGKQVRHQSNNVEPNISCLSLNIFPSPCSHCSLSECRRATAAQRAAAECRPAPALCRG